MANWSPNFSVLGEIPGVFREAQQRAARERTLANLGQGDFDYNQAARALLSAGDMQGAMTLAQLGQNMEQQQWTRTYQGGMLDVARQNANRQEKNPDIAKLEAAGINPRSAEGRKALFPRTDTPISATDKKAIFEAEDTLPQLQGTKEALARAKELNTQTFTGYTAGIRGALGTKLPGGGALVDKNAALATEEWSKIMGPEALQQMANTLKGATTDFELRKFIEMLADPTTHPKVRASVLDRMEKLTDRKLELQQSRVKDLRGGSYFKPQEQRGITQEEYNALPSGATYTAPDGSVRTKR